MDVDADRTAVTPLHNTACAFRRDVTAASSSICKTWPSDPVRCATVLGLPLLALHQSQAARNALKSVTNARMIVIVVHFTSLSAFQTSAVLKPRELSPMAGHEHGSEHDKTLMASCRTVAQGTEWRSREGLTKSGNDGVARSLPS
jgi:hypothetical protein